MISWITLIIVPSTLILLLLSIYALTTAKSFFNRIIITTLLIMGMGIELVALNQMLSQPKPAFMEWLYKNTEEVEVLAATFIRNEAIYLWLKLPDIKEPRYYIFEWDNNMVEQLQNAIAEKERKGEGRVMLKSPFDMDNSLEIHNDLIEFFPISRQLPLKPEEEIE